MVKDFPYAGFATEAKRCERADHNAYRLRLAGARCIELRIPLLPRILFGLADRLDESRL